MGVVSGRSWIPCLALAAGTLAGAGLIGVDAGARADAGPRGDTGVRADAGARADAGPRGDASTTNPDRGSEGRGLPAADARSDHARKAQAHRICLVCGKPVGPEDVTLLYRGRRVSLHRGTCLQAWDTHPEAYFIALQPRGALFQETETQVSPLADVWFVMGLYVVLGLIVGAICSYRAVGRGLSPLPWFFAGLAVNVVALAVLTARSPSRDGASATAVPGGLVKVPTTRPPRPCPSCGSDNHPAARRCTACGAPMERLVEPETSYVRRDTSRAPSTTGEDPPVRRGASKQQAQAEPRKGRPCSS